MGVTMEGVLHFVIAFFYSSHRARREHLSRFWFFFFCCISLHGVGGILSGIWIYHYHIVLV